MATLTETAYFGRKFINIGAIVIAVLLALRLVIGLATGIWRQLFPPPPPPATLAFGTLPVPSAQINIATPSGAITYTIETIDGGFPAAPNTVKVYFMPPTAASFGSFDRMKALAAKMGFTDVPLRNGLTVWHFTDTGNPLRTLDIDELSSNFRLVYNYVSDVSIFASKNFTSSDQAINTGKGFFDGLGVLPSTFKTGIPAAYFFKFDSGTLVPTTSLSNADAISVTFNRSDIDQMPVVSPDFRQGLVSVLISGSSDPKKQLLEARFFSASVDSQNWGTYPVITASVAFDTLKAGKAIFASLPTPLSNAISVRKVYLAYLDPYPAQSFLQPVWVFSDEKGFVAYVPAVAQ